MDSDKTTLRQRFLEERRALDPADAARRSASVRDRLWSLPAFLAARRVFTYVSAKDNEVDTRGIIEWLFAEGRAVACPETAPGRRMVWRQIESPNDLGPGRYGIPGPSAACPAIAPDAETVALVPGIVFARDGHRIGYGGGYFDRYLAPFPGTSIGLAYNFQLVESVPAAPYDVPVHWVMTDSGAFRATR